VGSRWVHGGDSGHGGGGGGGVVAAVPTPNQPSLAGVNILITTVSSVVNAEKKPQHGHRTFVSRSLAPVVFAVHAFHFKFKV
jgi:hypothetical protein